jgi:tetratricopeptide (TPR) repeat protein
MNDQAVNDQSDSAAPIDLTAPTVDEHNPWLGLASFTEETRAYFFGRDEEVAELARRVQRKLLTVLFGQSGLGKTSILRAGLVPRLRAQGYCPIYVRIDYGRDSPEPAEQIKAAINRTARHAGRWTQSGVAAEGESLWEFLHHRDDVLRDESGATLIPLLIFDQFEEIFTLAQSDDFGRARAARFIDELADLVENRPPKSLEAKLDEDETAHERFDFTRSDYRVLIALREDYLAPLEGLKKVMPSISQNRLRLAPMTGTQALAAVLQPGRKLVSEEVAAAIVRFVAGGAELANAEVEPSLLSLICRELNDARVAQGRSEISLDLLAGSHGTILSNFYERALADQPPAVRQIIEDDLLTSSGFRENVAEERLLSRFKAAGAGANTLAVLVNRRLLRIEERLDVRRVELTHDVLCGVVKDSRDVRREREAREATDRLLAEQHERELAARRALVRARKIAIGCTVLAVAALIAAGLAVLSTQRARRAELEAQQTRAAAEQARAGAEHLLGYLTDDFVRELEAFGRLNVVSEFTKRQIDYFHGLPPALKGTETTRNGALAMVHYARAMRILGDLDAGGVNAAEAIKLLEQQRAAGDASEATIIALALGYATQGAILDNRNDAAGPVASKRAADLLAPLAEAPNASVAVRSAYVQVLARRGYEQQSDNENEDAVRTEKTATRIAADLGARDLSNIDMAAWYAEAVGWEVTALQNLGRNEEARRVGEDAIAVADKVLERRPGYRLALHAEQVIEGGLTSTAQNDLNPAEALRVARRDEEVSFTLLNLDPNSTVSANNLGNAAQSVGDALWASGQLRQAIPHYSQAIEYFDKASAAGSGQVILNSWVRGGVAHQQAVLGDFSAAGATLATQAPFLTKLRQSEPQGSMPLLLVESISQVGVADTALEHGDFETARRIGHEVLGRMRPLKPTRGVQEVQKFVTIFWIADVTGQAEYQIGNYAAAESAEREAIEARKKYLTEAVGDRRDVAEKSTWLAMSLAKQGRLGEAAQVIGPVVQFHRELAAKSHGDRWQPMELASALYAEALAEPDKRAALLREAAALAQRLPATLQAVHDVQRWRERIQKAQQGAG